MSHIVDCDATHDSSIAVPSPTQSNTDMSNRGDSLLVLSKHWNLERQCLTFVIIFHRFSGKRLRLSRAAYSLLLEFATPTSADIVHQKITDIGAEPLSDLFRKHELLISPTTLKSEIIPPFLRRVEPTLFRAPPGQADSPQTNFAVFGVPYDGGNIVKPGSRFGPADIREVSIEYEYVLDLVTGRPRGWYDIDRSEKVLEGVTIADWGDIRVTYGFPPDATFAAIEHVYRMLIEHGCIALLLGGDHSVSYPAVKVCQEHHKVRVIWFDAHNDLGYLDARDSHHHGNVARRLSLLPNVDRLLVVGQRGMTSVTSREIYPAKVSFMSHRQLSAELSKMDHHGDINTYISVDIDVLDPAFAPGTATPVAAGMTPLELYDSLEVIASMAPVCGLDVVEVNCASDPHKITARHAAALILKMLASVSRRNR